MRNMSHIMLKMYRTIARAMYRLHKTTYFGEKSMPKKYFELRFSPFRRKNASKGGARYRTVQIRSIFAQFQQKLIVNFDE